MASMSRIEGHTIGLPAQDATPRVSEGPLTMSRARLRADTPGCNHVVHLNNAGAGLPPRPVVERVVRHLHREAEIGGYEAAREVAGELTVGRSVLAQLVGAHARNLALVESTTVGFHRVLSTLSLHRGDRVLLAGSEYGSTVLPLLQLARRIGLRVQFVPDGEDGSADPRALHRMLDEDVRLVCVVHAPSHNGLVNDVAEFGRELRAAGSRAWYVVDACQSLGQVPVDVAAIGCDFLLASGRKWLRGPRGTGLLVAGDRALAELDAYPIDVAGAQWVHTDDFRVADSAVRFESYERSVALTLGLMAAAGYAASLGVPELHAAIGRNAEYLRSRAGSLDRWHVLDRGRHRSGIVTLRHETVQAAETVAALRRWHINAWEVTPDLNPRDLGPTSVLRLSPHAYNTREELDRALSVLADQ